MEEDLGKLYDGLSTKITRLSEISRDKFIEDYTDNPEALRKLYNGLKNEKDEAGEFLLPAFQDQITEDKFVSDFTSQEAGGEDAQKSSSTQPTTQVAPAPPAPVAPDEEEVDLFSGLQGGVPKREMGWPEWAATQWQLGKAQGRRANYFETIGDLAFGDINDIPDEELKKIAAYNKQINALGAKLESGASEMGTWSRFGEDALGSLITSPVSAVTEVFQDEDALLALGTAAGGGAYAGLPGVVTGALFGAGVSMSTGGANVESAQIISDRASTYAQENGLDVENWEDLKKIYANEEFRKEAEKDAIVGAAIVVGADMLSAGVAKWAGAGRFALDTRWKAVKDRGTTFGIETAGEMVGEGTKQVAIGDDLSMRDIVLEGVGGAGSSVVQGAGVRAFSGDKPGVVQENQFLSELAENLSPETKGAYQQATAAEFEVEAIVPDTDTGVNSQEKTLGYEKSLDNAASKGIITQEQAQSFKDNKVKYEQAYQKLPTAIKEDAVKSREAVHLLMERDKVDAQMNALSLDEAFAKEKTRKAESLDRKRKAVNERLQSLEAGDSVASMNDYDNTGRAYRALLINAKEKNPKGSTPLRSEVQVRGNKLEVNNSEFLDSAKEIAGTMGLKMDSPKSLDFESISTAPIENLDPNLAEQSVNFGGEPVTVSIDGDVVTVDGDISSENYVRLSENFPKKRVVIPFGNNVNRVQRLVDMGLARKTADGYEVVDYKEAYDAAQKAYEDKTKTLIERKKINDQRIAVLDDDTFNAELENANRVLEGTGYTINVVDNDALYETEVGKARKNSRAITNTSKKTITVNRNKATPTTLRHEAAHAILKDNIETGGAKVDDKLMEFFTSMQEVLGGETASPRYRALLDEMNQFAQNYEKAGVKEKPLIAQEFLVELSAYLSANQERLVQRPNVVQQIIEKINDLYEALIRRGMRPLTTNSLSEAIDFVNGMADALDADVTQQNQEYADAILAAQKNKEDAATKVLNDAYQEVKEDQIESANKNLLFTNTVVSEVDNETFETVTGNRENTGDAHNVKNSRKGVDVGIYVHETNATPLSIPREVGAVLIDRGLPRKNRKKVKKLFAAVIRDYLAKADPKMHETAMAGEANFARQEDKDSHYLSTVVAMMATDGRNLMIPDDFNMATVERANDVIEGVLGYRPLTNGKFLMQMLYTMNGVSMKLNNPAINDGYWNFSLWEFMARNDGKETYTDYEDRTGEKSIPQFASNIGVPGEQLTLFYPPVSTKKTKAKKPKPSVDKTVKGKPVVTPTTQNPSVAAQVRKVVNAPPPTKTGPLGTQDFPNVSSKKIKAKLSPKKATPKNRKNIKRGDQIIYDGETHLVRDVKGGVIKTRQLDSEGKILPYGVETNENDTSIEQVFEQTGDGGFDFEAEMEKLRKSSPLGKNDKAKIESKVVGGKKHVTPPNSGFPNNSYSASQHAKGYAPNVYANQEGMKLDHITMNEYATRLTDTELDDSERQSYAYQTAKAISAGYFEPDNVDGMGPNTMTMITAINQGATAVDSTMAMGLTQVIYTMRGKLRQLEFSMNEANTASDMEAIQQQIDALATRQLMALNALKKTTSEGARILNLASQYVPTAAEMRVRKQKYLRKQKPFITDAQYNELSRQYDVFIEKYDAVRQDAEDNAVSNAEALKTAANTSVNNIKTKGKKFKDAVKRFREFLGEVAGNDIFQQIQQNPQRNDDAEFYQHIYEVATNKILEDNLTTIDEVVSAVLAEKPRKPNRPVDENAVLTALALGLESNKKGRNQRMATADKMLKSFSRTATELDALIKGMEKLRNNPNKGGVDFGEFTEVLKELITKMSEGRFGVPVDLATNTNALLVLKDVLASYDSAIFTESGNVDVAAVKMVGDRIRAALRLMDLVNKKGDITTETWQARLEEKAKLANDGVITDALLTLDNGNFGGISPKQARAQYELKLAEGELNALKSKVATQQKFADDKVGRTIDSAKQVAIGTGEAVRSVAYSFDISYTGYQAFLSTIVQMPGTAGKLFIMGLINPKKAKNYWSAYKGMGREMYNAMALSTMDMAMGGEPRIKDMYLSQVSSNTGREMMSLISDSITSPLSSSQFTQQEELFASSVFGEFVDKVSKSKNPLLIPARVFTRPYQFSSDSYTMFMNAVRMGQYEMYKAAYPESTQEQRKRFLIHQMDMTGRGYASKEDNFLGVGTFLTSEGSQRFFGAPRLLLSRINLFTRLYKEITLILQKAGNKDESYTMADFEILSQYLSMAVGYAVLKVLMEDVFGYELEDDPNDTAFMKFKKGEDVIDIGAGLTPFFKTGGYIIAGDPTNMKASQNDQRTPFDDITKFAMYKLHPQWNALGTLYSGENVIGQGLGVTDNERYWNTFASTYVPIMAQELFKVENTLQQDDRPFGKKVLSTIESAAGFNNYYYNNKLKDVRIVDYLDNLKYEGDEGEETGYAPRVAYQWLDNNLVDVTNPDNKPYAKIKGATKHNPLKKTISQRFRSHVEDLTGHYIEEQLIQGIEPTKDEISSVMKDFAQQLGPDYWELLIKDNEDLIFEED